MGKTKQIKYPEVCECHCMSKANKYRSRKFINMEGFEVIRIFYRCENCWSRIHSDFIPELDKKYRKVNVLDLLKHYNK